LLDGSGFCEEECHGNQRKITPRNWDSPASPWMRSDLFWKRHQENFPWLSEAVA
jgi:hypothetical protein